MTRKKKTKKETDQNLELIIIYNYMNNKRNKIRQLDIDD